MVEIFANETQNSNWIYSTVECSNGFVHKVRIQRSRFEILSGFILSKIDLFLLLLHAYKNNQPLRITTLSKLNKILNLYCIIVSSYTHVLHFGDSIISWNNIHD